MPYLKIIRPLNLLIVALTLWLFWNELFVDTFIKHNISFLATGNHILLITLMFLLIGGGGYVINDILDVRTDLINKREKMIISEQIAEKTAWIYYAILNISAISLGLFLTITLKSFSIIGIGGLAILLLWWYSRFLKSSILVGNVVVSLMVGFVPFIFLAIENQALMDLAEVAESAFIRLLAIIFSYITFAFLANLVREIIKDCEDADGDLKARIYTMATVLGLKKSDKLSSNILIVLFILSVAWIFMMDIYNSSLDLSLFTVLVLFPIGYIVYHIRKSERVKSKYTYTSNLLKGLMGCGLLYLLIHLNL